MDGVGDFGKVKLSAKHSTSVTNKTHKHEVGEWLDGGRDFDIVSVLKTQQVTNTEYKHKTSVKTWMGLGILAR